MSKTLGHLSKAQGAPDDGRHLATLRAGPPVGHLTEFRPMCSPRIAWCLVIYTLFEALKLGESKVN